MNDLLNEIQNHLAQSSKNRIILQTHTRATAYAPKHVGMFSAKAGDAGVYVQHGKGKVYAMPHIVRFAHLEG